MVALALPCWMGAHAQAGAPGLSAEVQVRAAAPGAAFVHAFEEASCTKGALLASTDPRDAPAKARVPVTGKPIYLRATTTHYTGGPANSDSPELLYAIARNTCTRLVSFVPLAERHYTLELNASSYACPLQVVEVEYGYAPKDLRAHAVGRGCELAP